MNNAEFLNALEESFAEFIRSGTSRSTAKLVPLHGAIAHDMHDRFGDGYTIQSQGYAQGREGTISGRYMDKKVDITILRRGVPVCGIAVKFVMQNYAQNSNNYFENMLGETANIRASRCPYFQVFAIPDCLPYYNRKGEITRWETITDNNLHKYCILDADDPEVFYHSPNKILIYVVHLPGIGNVRNRDDYLEKYAQYIASHRLGFMSVKNVARFGNTVIHNDYETFAQKIYHAVLAQ